MPQIDHNSRSVLGRGIRSKLAGDALTLSTAHLVGLLTPFITVPYLARVLQPEGFGLLVFAQSFALWLVLVVEFGFDLSGTRVVSRIRQDSHSLAKTVLGIQSAKIIVFFLVIPLVITVFFTVPLFAQNPVYLIWGFLYAGSRGLTPNWYFLGQERMAVPALLEASGKVLATIGVFLLVHSPEDGWRVLALQALGLGSATFCMTLWMHSEISWARPSLMAGFQTLKESSGIFVFRGASGLYMQANAFILGLLVAPSMVGFFGGAERIVRAAISLLQPISQAFFPRVSHSVLKDTAEVGRLLRLSFFWIGGLGVVMGSTSFLAAPLLVNLLLGPGYDIAIPILQVLSVLAPIIGVGTVFGIQWALPMGLEFQFSMLVLFAGVLNILLALILVPSLGGMGMAGSVVIAEALVAGGLILLFKRRGGRFWPLGVPQHDELQSTYDV